MSKKRSNSNDSTGNVVDFASVRAKRNLENRRGTERFFLRQMIDTLCELDGKAELPLEVVEVSESGCSFRISSEKAEKLPKDLKGKFNPLQVRMYFSKDSYLKIGLNIVTSTADISDGKSTLRFRCSVDTAFASTQAYVQFVRFIEQFSEHCSKDQKQVSAL